MQLLRSSAIIIACLAIGTTSLFAQSDLDTLRAIDVAGNPGDTVAVPVFMVNSFQVSGIQLRVVFDPQVLQVIEIDTAGTRVSGVYTVFPTSIANDSGYLEWSGIHFYDPYNNYVTRGTGTVAYIIFEIDGNAPAGSQTPIVFEDDVIGPGFYNALSDRMGSLIFPTTVHGEVRLTSTGIQEGMVDLNRPPKIFFLDHASPNPFSSSTSIRYGVPQSSDGVISIRVYNASGSLVRVLLEETQRPGWHLAKWDGRSDRGMLLPDGAYFCRLEASGKCFGMQKIVLLK